MNTANACPECMMPAELKSGVAKDGEGTTGTLYVVVCNHCGKAGAACSTPELAWKDFNPMTGAR